MTVVATASNPRFTVSRVDIDRPGPTYTLDTLRDLHAQRPDAELFFITGADALAQILSWKGVEQLWDLAQFIGVTRPGHRLSDEGLDQADRAAGAVASFVSAPVRVVTSQLRRAMQTGAAIADRLGVTPVADPAWDEQDFGDWDGRSLADLRAQHPDELTALRNDRHWSGHGGESHEQVLVRVRAALADLLDGAQPGETIVIVSHRRPMMAVVELVLGVDLPHAWQLAAAPASLTGLEFPADGPPTRGLVSFANDTHHLRHPSAVSGGRAE